MDTLLNFWNPYTPAIQAQPPEDLRSNKEYVPPNSSLNFEKRIRNPSQYPSLSEGEQSVTHKMAWDDFMGKFVAFPTVVQTPDGSLKDLGDAAYDYALRSGEYRQFKTAKEAEDYARGGYKNQWAADEWSAMSRWGK